jgi:pyruvate,orthophosphate dikinase
MDPKFKSQALEANLAETRYKNIEIPENHRKFIAFSEKYFGIHKRAQECVTEFHHPLSNRKFVVEELRKMLITDFWFYKNLSMPKAVFAFDVMIAMFDRLLQGPLMADLVETVIKTLLEFSIKAHSEGFDDQGKKSLEILDNALDKHPEPFISSGEMLKKKLNTIVDFEEKFSPLCVKLYSHSLQSNINYWLDSTPYRKWIEEHPKDVSSNTRNSIQEFFEVELNSIKKQVEKAHNWHELASLPHFDDIANRLESITENLPSFTEQFHYIFFLLRIPGMNQRQERLIWQIDKLLRNALSEVPEEGLIPFSDQIFNLCSKMKERHPSSVLDILLTLGKVIIDRDETEDKHIINDFEKKLIDFGFQTPGMVYVNEDWQLHVNPNHIKNIRTWLELIEYSQSVMEKLLGALIVNLRLGGIFISDTDLFQRDITKILNSNISPYYKKVKQLTRIFPVYFNEIGAEGEIRDTTTSMDEIFKRQDRLVHFLRKQVHTESNNTLIILTKKVFRFWQDGDKNSLKEVLPKGVFDAVSMSSDYFVDIHNILNHMLKHHHLDLDEFLRLAVEQVEKMLDALPEAISNEHDKLRLREGVRLYALLKEKYSFDTVDIISMLNRYPVFHPDEIAKLSAAVRSNNYKESLRLIYLFMEQLKEIIFNPNPSESWENIYHKRHIAIGIPSMYGVYREPKFEALGLTFRLERIATRLMERVVQDINLDYISNKTLQDVYNILHYFREGLALDGISSQAFDSNLSMLKYSLSSRSFSLGQYINIFRFMADDVKKIISKYFLKSYEYPLQIIVPQLFDPENKLNEKERSRLLNEKSEIFTRDIISSAFLVQPLDSFISRLIDSLNRMVDTVDPGWLHDIMTYNSDMAVSRLYEPAPEIDNQVFLGSKAFFLKKLLLAGYPVPPGFVVSTEVFRRINAIHNHPMIKQELEQKLLYELKQLEKVSGKQFGNPENPLLLSVRSGTAISMPGAMDTFLNVGMNDRFTEALAKQPDFGWTSWDCYRRLLQSWGMFFGIDRDVFDQIMIDFKEAYHIDLKVRFKPETMREMAYEYKATLKKHGVDFEEDLFKQLYQTMTYVFESWSSKRAQVYRDHLQIADEWGTAVIIQKMILGNLNLNSGTGVVFTQNPNRQRPGVHLYGDFVFSSQGEDIVGGLVHVHPVGKTQRLQLHLEELSLQELVPEIYKEIHRIATNMTENQGYNPQEIEFTFESGNPKDLYILQTRDQDIKSVDIIQTFSTPSGKMNLVGRGTGVGGGALNGVLVFDKNDVALQREKHPDRSIILVRPDTVPDDIDLIFESDGLLTAKGGATSHAAVTAVRLGKTCVVNCSALIVDEEQKKCRINKTTFTSGDLIAIDGKSGSIYKGNYPTEETRVRQI